MEPHLHPSFKVQQPSLRRAFTLVELLVVIAIIMLLAALLLPALKSARGTALAVRCASNLRQYGLAVQMYTQDHNDTLLPYTSINTWFWCVELQSEGYIPKHNGVRNLRCPVNQAGYGGQNTDPNLAYSNELGAFRPDLGAVWWVKWSQIVKPADRLMICDSQPGGGTVPGDLNRCAYAIDLFAPRLDPDSPACKLGDYHQASGNILWCDSHVTREPRGSQKNHPEILDPTGRVYGP